MKGSDFFRRFGFCRVRKEKKFFPSTFSPKKKDFFLGEAVDLSIVRLSRELKGLKAVPGKNFFFLPRPSLGIFMSFKDRLNLGGKKKENRQICK